MTPIARIVSLLTLSVVALAGAPPTNDLDTFIKAQMSQRQINGLSLAIIQDGRIDRRACVRGHRARRRAGHDDDTVSGGIDQQTGRGHGCAEVG